MAQWIEWKGDERAPEGDIVEVRLREGVQGGIDPREELRWSHDGGVGDIVAYRLADAPKVTKDTNPKDAAAVGRVPLHMVPDTLLLFAAMGFAEGDSKYIAYNFRVAGARASVYVSALGRHFMRYKNGEWADKKTKVPHLASMASCLSILIDGHVTGLINDDRPPPVDLDAEFERAEEIIKHVYEMNAGIRPKDIEYTINTHPAKGPV